MNRFGTVMLLSGLSVIAFGQGSPVYLPTRSIADQKIRLQGWGSGTISQTEEIAYEGVYSLRVSTRNFFQGGIVGFSEPKDLTSAYNDANNLLQITLRLATGSVTIAGGTAGGGGGGGVSGGGTGLAGSSGSGGGGGGGAGQASGGAGGTGGGGRGAGGGAAGGGTRNTGTVVEVPLQNIRVIVTTTDGKKSEAYVPVNAAALVAGWKGVAIPLKALTGFDRTNKIVKDIAFSGDAMSTFYVGEMKVVNDTTSISGDVSRTEYNLALGDEIDFSATGFGGASVLVYQWDFNKNDGIQVDAEGQVVKRKFRTPGTYVVTVTIADKYGLKKPVTKEITVKVNP